MNNHISIATAYDLLKIRAIWDEMFPAEKEYQDFIFSEIIPLCTNYIIKECSGAVVSVISLMPMNFVNDVEMLQLKGWYMFGVATKSGFEGKGYASSLISHTISELQRNGYDFIFERPANQELINFYLKFGFTKLIKKQRYSFQHIQTLKITPYNTPQRDIETISDQILTEIRDDFKTRFEWANTTFLKKLIELGEIDRHNELQTSESLQERCFIAVKILNNTPDSIFNNAFFCFPME
ncbi:MAG: GNAT family N-acetyltransferase [Bacteroidales bacterium]|nr:GNAT family N-acetyltransferase [Bacteroidales bacterium]